ncbi:hypothetical protein BD410DRAFT_749362 [Rickenella mellea]|uniref:AAA+ ATPase domain-containing protein n=1 Tax=Rickenella mellea TaxID=50990 RepID=A0A4Y7Q4H4_9AGAM|nr:hypothetical protein BD410DRAFT_749362 [Rickenella mellea]
MKPAELWKNTNQISSVVTKPDSRGVENAPTNLQKEFVPVSALERVSLFVVTIILRSLLFLVHILEPPMFQETNSTTESSTTLPRDNSSELRPQWRRSIKPGSRDLCATIVKGNVEWATKLLKRTPSLVNLRHPLGWTPLHTAVLSGNLAILALVLETPGINLSIKVKSTFRDIFSEKVNSEEDSLIRSEELCPYMPGTLKIQGMTALHFACMTGDWKFISLVVNACPLFEVRDDEGYLPSDYFDLSLVDGEVSDNYSKALKAWQKRSRSLKRRDVGTLCDAVRDGEIGFCREILEKNPSLIAHHTKRGWTALHSAVINKRHEILDLFLSSDDSKKIIDMHDDWDGDVGCADRSSFASDEFAHRAQHGSTSLHYACLMGDMVAAEKLLRAGADWRISDYRGLRPEEHIDVDTGDGVKLHFIRLCKKEAERRKCTEVGDNKDPNQPGGPCTWDNDVHFSNRDQYRSPVLPLMSCNTYKGGNFINHGQYLTLGASWDNSSGPPLSCNCCNGGNFSDCEHDRRKDVKDDSQLTGEELERFKRDNPIETLIGARIIGQKGPIRSVASAIRLRENGWVDPDRPLVMLFLGSSGVGKTELAKQITIYLNGGFFRKRGSQSITDIEKSGAFIRIDMSEFQHSHTVSNLTGSPKGYVGYEEGGILTNKLKENPKALVLLDEIEKAHPDVLTVFLQVFDDGRITDPKFGTIECKDAVFIMTSNLGSEQIREAAPELRALVAEIEGRHEEYLRVIGQFNRDLHPILKTSLKRDEFLGRINQIVVFLPLNDEEISQVIGNELKKWRKRAADTHGINLSWSTTVVAKLVQAYDVNYGVRSVVNETQRVAVQLLAESQIGGILKRIGLCTSMSGSLEILK